MEFLSKIKPEIFIFVAAERTYVTLWRVVHHTNIRRIYQRLRIPRGVRALELRGPHIRVVFADLADIIGIPYGHLAGNWWRRRLVIRVLLVDLLEAVRVAVVADLPPLLHLRLLLEFTVVRHVAYDFGVLFYPQRLRVVRHLGEFAFALLEVRVVLYVGLEFRVFGDPLQFRCLRHRSRLCLWYMTETGIILFPTLLFVIC